MRYIIQINLTDHEYKHVHAGNMLEEAGFTDLVWIGSTGIPGEENLGAVKYSAQGSEENLAFLTLKHKNFYFQTV